jgi:hypothetical protein
MPLSAAAAAELYRSAGGINMPENWDSILKQMKTTALGRLARPVWRPTLVARDGQAAASKIGGTPWLAADEDWPACQNCGQPMPLLVQLNLDDLPTSVGPRFGTGLLQAFYCWNTDPDCTQETRAWDAGSTGSKWLRLFKPIGEPRDPRTAWRSGRREVVPLAGAAPAPPFVGPTSVRVDDPVRPARLTGWEQDVDYPTAADAEAQGVPDYATYLAAAGVAADWDYNFPYNGIKVGGWPYWLQSREWARCPTCHREMTRLLFQLPHHELPSERQFGDNGTAYLLQCEDHPDRLVLLWQC